MLEFSKDYRLKENRKDAFLYWCYWSLKYKDCDPALWLLNYLFDFLRVIEDEMQKLEIIVEKLQEIILRKFIN